MQQGASLPEFSLRGTDGKMHSPTSDAHVKGTMVLFVCNHCPYVQRYATRIKHIVQTYSGKGLQVFGINANDASRYPEDSFDKMPDMAERLGLGGRYLHDESQEIARQFKAERTPEAYLFNANGELVYRGAIDDSDADPKLVSERYLEEAIDAVLLNKQIQTDYNPPVGCSIKWKQNG